MVDGAVVMVENAFRIMAERLEHGEKVDRTSAVLAAAKEVATPIAFAITIIIVVFLPLFALEGLEGKMRSEEHTSELQSLMRISYAVFCLKKKKNKNTI